MNLAYLYTYICMFQQESVPVKATTSTLKEDTPTEEVVVREGVVKQKDTAAIIDLREQLHELEVERVEKTDKELGRGAYGGDICYPEPEYLLREKIYLPKRGNPSGQEKAVEKDMEKAISRT